MIDLITIILIIIIVVLVIALYFFYSKFQSLKEKFQNLLFDKRSQSIKYGKLTEQWIPFSEQFPFKPENFRFIGIPIDGLAFEEDKIYFVEFKTATADLNKKQKKIKQLIKDKQVEWKEFKIK